MILTSGLQLCESGIGMGQQVEGLGALGNERLGEGAGMPGTISG